MVVGSGTAAPEAERVCSAYYIRSRDTDLLLDCGPGAVHRMANLGLPWRDVRNVAISHFHNDHIGDLPMLLFAMKWGTETRRTEPLTLWGPTGLQERLDRLAHALGDHVSDPGFPLAVNEMRPGDIEAMGGEFRVRVAKTPHTAESLAWRVEARDGGTFGYTGDTGPSEEVADFLQDVDLLVAECALPDDDAIPTHLSPTSLAAMANRAAPRQLAVTHVYPWLDARDVLQRIREAGWTGGLVRATDGLTVDLPG
ncbi:MAG TPA: ribonuclease Z [Longimicrobiales bacterium]|nr:ribonuclease Z [Longimicrobiales bacterium]